MTEEKDLTAAQMKTTLQHYADEHKNMKVDCFVCCILTHGGSQGLHGCDGEPVKIRDIKSKFTAANCPGLAGKPKLFFIQACRGSDEDRGYKQRDNIPRMEPGISCAEFIPIEADFLTAYATPDGYISWRDTEQGSEYIQALTQVIRDYRTDMDIQRILTKVNEVVSEKVIPAEGKNGKEHNYKQIPEPSSTLRKLFYFR